MIPLVFLPGAGGSASFWRPVAERLADLGPAHVLGSPGCAGVRPDPGVQSLDDLFRWIVARLLAGESHLVAQSMGGVLAARLAIERPERVGPSPRRPLPAAQRERLKAAASAAAPTARTAYASILRQSFVCMPSQPHANTASALAAKPICESQREAAGLGGSGVVTVRGYPSGDAVCERCARTRWLRAAPAAIETETAAGPGPRTVEASMPLVRIDVRKGKTPAYRAAIADGVHRAMVETINVPSADRFQIVTEHPAEGLVYDPSYLGIARSDDLVVVQITLNAGRTVEMKRALYARIVELLGAAPGVRREDVMVSLVEVAKENWSFGNGIAQYA
jgi:phenylpyruvate tautomerase PptA (4-oxalocrotonate tautomerase family)